MKYKKIMFIGCLNIEFSLNNANSPAANQVQMEIIDNISKVFSDSTIKVSANKPKRTWPFSNFFERSETVDNYKFQAYLNLLFIREISIYVQHLLMIYTFKPDIIFKYNTTFFESLFLYFVKFLFGTKIVLFVQDVSYQHEFSKSFFKYLETLGLRLASSFDVIVPITKHFVYDFDFPEDKCIVFQGGLTSQAKLLISSKFFFEEINNSNFFVFAGALEEYNGIKEIVDYWVNTTPDFNLHIYGKGTFEEYVKKSASKVSNIKYFGFAQESRIIEDQLLAFGNFCFRNSRGINQKYFFPSKFYNVLASPGRAFVNDFENMPADVREKCCLLKDDLSNFGEIISSIRNIDNSLNYSDRISWLTKNANWSLAITEVKKLLK